MALNGSSFIKNYKKKLSVENIESVNEAIYYAFKLTDIYGINKINKALFEASVKFNIDEEVLTNNIDNFFEGEMNE
jgi:hypothetical protein